MLNEREIKQCVVFCSMMAFLNNHKNEYIAPFNIRFQNLETLLAHMPDVKEEFRAMGFKFHRGVLFNEERGIKMVLLRSEEGHHYLGYGDASALQRFGEDQQLEGPIKQASKSVRKRALKQLLIGDRSSEEKTREATAVLIRSLELNQKNLTLFGQCYGGLLSAYTALSLGYKSIGINSVSFGAHTQVHLGAKLNRAKTLLTHIFTEGDVTQSYAPVSALDLTFSRLGLHTPGCYGKKFHIPNAGYGLFGRHIYTLACCFSALGLDRGTLIGDLDAERIEGFRESGFKQLTDIE
jgi:hypothetical protein